MSVLSYRAKGTAVIKAPVTNLTIGASVTAFVAAVLVLWDETYEKFFGFKPEQHPGVARAVVVTIIAAVTLMWIADVVARAIASAQPDTPYAPAPAGWTADVDLPDRDQKGYIVAAIRITAGGAEFLLVKEGEAPAWKPLPDIDLHT